MLLFEDDEDEERKKLKEEEQEEGCGDAAAEERPLPQPPVGQTPPAWSRALSVPEGPVVTPPHEGNPSRLSKESKSSWSKLRVK